MVRRGNRATGPVGNNTSTSSSSASNNQSGNRWSRSRPNSANSGEMKGAKCSDSNRSSPTASSQSTSSSPPGKKGQGNSRGSRSASYWRGSVSSSGGSTTTVKVSGVPRDSKFAITNEDFPALPIVRAGGNSHSTPNKQQNKNIGKNGSSVKLREILTTDDSGLSSGSRGHTPPLPDSALTVPSGSAIKSDKRFSKQVSSDPSKRKPASPAKDRAPRGSTTKPLRSLPSPLGTSSPKKKSINSANSGTTAPSFMKLSKLGQKIPERRGGTRQSNHSLSPTDNSNSPTSDEKENRTSSEASPADTPVATPSPLADTTITMGTPDVEPAKPRPPINPLNINVGRDGEMSNIPASMLTDQFGMAALLPMLEVVKGMKTDPPPADMSQRTKEQKLHSDITTLSLGLELATLHVPIKTAENCTKTIWQSFSGPFGQEPMAPTSIGLASNQVPSVYYTARTLRGTVDMTLNIPDKFGVHELFYIFYNIPKELWQVNAARELMWRGWRYNKTEFLWIHKQLGEQDDYSLTVAPPHNALTQVGANPDEIIAGVFEIYDAEKARITCRELCFKRSDIEIPFFEMRAPDTYQMVLGRVFSKEMLWGGPREDYNKPSALIGFPGMAPRQNGQINGNKPSNLNIPKVPLVQQQPPLPQQQVPQQNSVRRLLSFADSPEATPSFETPFGQIPPPANAEEAYRHQMYAIIMQKMHQSQMLAHQQHQQQRAASSTVPSVQSQSSSSMGNMHQS